MSAPRVTEIDPLGDPRWDEFVAGHPDAVVYQHSGWLRCLHAEYGRPVDGLCVEEDGRLVGVMPLVATRGVPLLRGNRVVGARISSLPRTPVAGPVARDRQVANALLEAAVARAREEDAALVQIKRAAADLEPPPPGVGGAPWRRSYVLSLPGTPDELRYGNSRNHSRIRWAVNKARKEGVHVRDAETLADVQAWYRIYLETMREVVVPPRPARLFEAMWKELMPRGLMRFHLAERRVNGRATLIAGSIILGLRHTAFYAFNGRRRDALTLRPNDVIQWEAIRAACDAGFERYDLGEVVEGDVGLSEFKRKWGSNEVRMHRYYHPPPEHEVEHDDAEEGGGLRGRITGAATATWKRLPLGATRAVGDMAYRWL